MILTGAKLEEFGRAIWGEVWVARLSERLKLARRTLWRKRHSPTGLPLSWQRQLLDCVDEQIKAQEERLRVLGTIRNELAETFYDC